MAKVYRTRAQLKAMFAALRKRGFRPVSAGKYLKTFGHANLVRSPGSFVTKSGRLKKITPLRLVVSPVGKSQYGNPGWRWPERRGKGAR